jgi:hypothetical protein
MMQVTKKKTHCTIIGTLPLYYLLVVVMLVLHAHSNTLPKKHYCDECTALIDHNNFFLLYFVFHFMEIFGTKTYFDFDAIQPEIKSLPHGVASVL